MVSDTLALVVHICKAHKLTIIGNITPSRRGKNFSVHYGSDEQNKVYFPLDDQLVQWNSEGVNLNP